MAARPRARPIYASKCFAEPRMSAANQPRRFVLPAADSLAFRAAAGGKASADLQWGDRANDSVRGVMPPLPSHKRSYRGPGFYPDTTSGAWQFC